MPCTTVGADLLHLVEGGARRHKTERAAVDALQRLPPQSQTEAVHRHHGQPRVADLKQRTGVDRTRLIGGHGEAGLVDHGLHGILLDGHRGQLRIVVGGQPGQLKAGSAAHQLHHVFLVGGEYHDIVGQAADHLAEQAGIQHDAALLMDLGGDGGADTGLHIVAGQRQLRVALQQHTLQRGDGALGRHRPGHGTAGLLEQRFFAGKFQHLYLVPFSYFAGILFTDKS